VLVVNAGSTSLKLSVVARDDTAEPVASLHEAPQDVLAVAHRVVHGGARFREPVIVNDAVEDELRALVELAPLHNGPAIAAIDDARRIMPTVPHVAVFDTAFHATLSPEAWNYAVPQRWRDEWGIRRYGFHGISVRWVAAGAARLLGRPLAELNLIVLHLGNGASATAVAGGRSVETSMGMTPLAGLVMGTRPGDVDPAVVFHLARSGLELDRIEDLYQHHSGLSGLCGENDMRAILRRVEAGDPAATLALDVYCHRIRGYVGAYHAALGRLDAIVFTAGVGEHSAVVRARCLAGLELWGIEVDPARNAAGAPERIVSPDAARVRVCVVPTNEEAAIAQEVSQLLS